MVTGGMPAGGIAAIIIVIALVVIGIPVACYYCSKYTITTATKSYALEIAIYTVFYGELVFRYCKLDICGWRNY